jgi:hypothetical protein
MTPHTYDDGRADGLVDRNRQPDVSIDLDQMTVRRETPWRSGLLRPQRDRSGRQLGHATGLLLDRFQDVEAVARRLPRERVE